MVYKTVDVAYKTAGYGLQNLQIHDYGLQNYWIRQNVPAENRYPDQTESWGLMVRLTIF